MRNYQDLSVLLIIPHFGCSCGSETILARTGPTPTAMFTTQPLSPRWQERVRAWSPNGRRAPMPIYHSTELPPLGEEIIEVCRMMMIMPMTIAQA